MPEPATRLIVIGGRNNIGSPQRIVRTRPPLKFDRAFLEERGNQLKLVQIVIKNTANLIKNILK